MKRAIGGLVLLAAAASAVLGAPPLGAEAAAQGKALRVAVKPIAPFVLKQGTALTGFSMAFARAVGEYGSVVFISGNMPMKTEITPLLIITKLEQYDYAGATAIAVVMLVSSFTLLLTINLLQAWSGGRLKRAHASELPETAEFEAAS